jgi:ribosomal protein L34E
MQPKNRSNSVRKLKRKSPSGKSTTLFRRRPKGGAHHDHITGQRLHGTTSAKGAKSTKVPSRIYGGHLSGATTRKVLVYAARLKEGTMAEDDVDVRLLPYVRAMLKKL